MSLIGNIQKRLDSKQKRWSSILTLTVCLIILTPLCGFLFQCGCNWPWSGLDTHCNFYKPLHKNVCPWCSSMIIGLLSTVSAMITAAGTTTAASPWWQKQPPVKEISMRTLSGVTGFLVISITSAAAAAIYQGYPFGIGSYWN